MRKYGFVFFLGLTLAFIAFQARTGIFRRKDPGPPANKYTREIMEGKRLPKDDLQLIKKKYPNAVVTSSGLRYIIERIGAGDPAPTGGEIVVNYEGYLLSNGHRFDSSYNRGQPLVFQIGRGRVIAGLDEALASMKKGEKRTLIIPWWLGYGIDGKGDAIPPRATLVFEVELIDIDIR